MFGFLFLFLFGFLSLTRSLACSLSGAKMRPHYSKVYEFVYVCMCACVRASATLRHLIFYASKNKRVHVYFITKTFVCENSIVYSILDSCCVSIENICYKTNSPACIINEFLWFASVTTVFHLPLAKLSHIIRRRTKNEQTKTSNLL